jgi:putative membrane protein
MLIIKAVHIIAMVAWFAGLFYLPRLFVYHADAVDRISIERFKIMERRLYYAITWPAAIFTTVLGTALLTYNLDYYLKAGWMHTKLAFVILLWGYHLACGHYVALFAGERNTRTTRFYRFFNEVPTVLLIVIVFAVVLKPS